MIILPTGAVIVKQRIEKYKNSGGIILEDTSALDKVYNDGEIIFTAPELTDLQSKKIVFRPNYAEEIDIKGEKYLFFRDVQSSMYYIIEE